jgi:hypothetical protein
MKLTLEPRAVSAVAKLKFSPLKASISQQMPRSHRANLAAELIARWPHVTVAAGDDACIAEAVEGRQRQAGERTMRWMGRERRRVENKIACCEICSAEAALQLMPAAIHSMRRRASAASAK